MLVEVVVVVVVSSRQPLIPLISIFPPIGSDEILPPSRRLTRLRPCPCRSRSTASRSLRTVALEEFPKNAIRALGIFLAFRNSIVLLDNGVNHGIDPVRPCATSPSKIIDRVIDARLSCMAVALESVPTKRARRCGAIT